MSEVLTITSPHNHTARKIASLYRPKERREQGLTIVEGLQVLELALLGKWVPDEVLYSPSRIGYADKKILDLAAEAGGQLISVSDEVLRPLSKREGPLGMIATVKIPEMPDLESLKLPPKPLIVVAEAVEKPGSLGVLVRTASAAGADAFIVAYPQADVFDPASINASLGSVFTIPIVATSSQKAIKWLKDSGVTIIATSPSAPSSYYQEDLNKPISIIVGNDHLGLSEDWLKAGQLVKIPMAGPMNSLNSTTAAALLLFEAVRQRNPT